MARLLTTGFETRSIAAEGQGLSAFGTLLFDTENEWDGSVCLKCAKGAENRIVYTVTHSLGTTYYYQSALKFSSLTPSANMGIMRVSSGVSSAIAEPSLLTNGKISVWSGYKAVVMAETPTALLEVNKYYLFELKLLVPSAGNGTLGFTIRDESGKALYESGDKSVELGNSAITSVTIGHVGGETATDVYTSHFIVNDSTEEHENSWPGYQKVSLLKPESDEGHTGFTNGSGGTTELYKCLANFPPIGQASGSSTTTSQIKDAENNTTGTAVIASLPYTSLVSSGGGGITLPRDVVKVITGIARFGNSSTKQRAFGIKLAGGEEKLSTNPATVAGTDPTGWTTIITAPAYSPTPPGSETWYGPNLSLFKKSASIDVAMFDMAGVYVSYEPGKEEKHEYSVSITDTLSPSQTVTRTITVTQKPSEALSTSATPTRVTGTSRKASEILSVADSAARSQGGFVRILTTALSVSDLPTVTGHIYAKIITETLSLSDAVKRIFTGTREPTETLSTADLPQRSTGAHRGATEILSTSETPKRMTVLMRTIAQALTLSENPSRLANFLRGAPNSLSTSDGAHIGQGVSKGVSETITTSEIPKRQGAFGRSPNETLTVSDSTNRSTSITRSVTEAIVTSETTKRLAVLVRKLTATLTTSDATTRAKGAALGIIEALTTSDEPTRVAPGSFTRKIAQSNILTETVGRILNAARSVTDLVTGIDSPKREVFTIYHGEHPITVEVETNEITWQGGRDEIVLKTHILEPTVIETDEDNLVFELHDDSLIFDRESEDLILNTVTGVEARRGRYEDRLVLDVDLT